MTTNKTTYELSSAKGKQTVKGTLADAIRAAKAMDAELQPARGVDIWTAGEKVASVDGDRVEDAFGEETIVALMHEAEEAGDRRQVDVCERALLGDDAARAECARVIADAAAQG